MAKIWLSLSRHCQWHLVSNGIPNKGIAWKRFLKWEPTGRRIYQDSHHKGPTMWNFDGICIYIVLIIHIYILYKACLSNRNIETVASCISAVPLPSWLVYDIDWHVVIIFCLWYMMTSSNGKIFRVTGLLCGEFTGLRWIPRTKASDAELWCFHWSAPEPTVEQTMETLVIWDANTRIVTSL